ncbi:hypothetical protein QL285_014214 [Trifolium repens]|nr:hypothetical protein QL285_014214 [Trifolium repens]
MDTLVLERGKRPKQEVVSKPESESDSESDSDSESGPNWDWTLKREKDLEISDFSSYDNDPVPFCYVCPRFKYINEAMRRQEEERQKALAQYRDLSRNLTPFDAIPVPPKIKIMASNFPHQLT